MKIYAADNNILAKYVGKPIWIPVGFDDDDLYGWVNVLSSKLNTTDGIHHYRWYKSKLIKVDDVIRYKNRQSHGVHGLSLDSLIQDYTFESNHFDFIDSTRILTFDELNEEFDSVYDAYITGRAYR